ncbi:MAG: hypothetical protein MZV64_11045 [Ignavibacteriales bacterium]|nr:hypothetical protein [Ignavibacteriales bacterium]
MTAAPGSRGVPSPASSSSASFDGGLRARSDVPGVRTARRSGTARPTSAAILTAGPAGIPMVSAS